MAASKRFRILALAAALVLLAAAPAAAQATWTQVPSPNRPGSNELQGADGAVTSQVWAVGRVVDASANPAAYRSLILRWDGSAWAPATHPRFARNHALRAVAAPAADDAWAVGTRQVASGGLVTLVERWDGARWSTVASPNPDPGGLNELNGVAGVPSAPGTVWAVGAYSKPNANFGTLKLILRRTGGGWQVLGSPTFTPEDHLEAVDATGPADAWAVGWGSTSPFGGTAVGIALRWDGSSWRSVPIPQPSPIMLFGVVTLAPNDVWAVGHTYLGGPHWVPSVLHWDGTAWSRATIPAFPSGGQLRDVVALSPTNVYAVGLDGEGFNARSLVLHWDGGSWTRQATPSPPVGPKLYGAAAIGPSTVWGVGDRYDQRLAANQSFTIRATNG
ncbi:MAG TPA: hypothetical protein VFL71_12305 [Actinomycetes bacterium]|nr:hypothetical protein [Actinomycetes bacterium]